jgi:hypothetical protein
MDVARPKVHLGGTQKLGRPLTLVVFNWKGHRLSKVTIRAIIQKLGECPN